MLLEDFVVKQCSGEVGRGKVFEGDGHFRFDRGRTKIQVGMVRTSYFET